MLDVKRLRANFEEVKEKLRYRNEDIQGLDSFLQLDRCRRQLVQQTDELKKKRNDVSREIAEKKKNKQNVEEKIKEMRQVGEQIKQYDRELRELDEQLHQILIALPNIPHESVPIGLSEDENQPVRYWGEIPQPAYSFKTTLGTCGKIEDH